MACVDRRSWMKSGSVGTSNDSRSALPAHSRKGRDSAFSAALAARNSALALSASSGVVACASAFAAASMRAMSASPCSRAGLPPSHCIDGASDGS
jgi:hypothetical protein